MPAAHPKCRALVAQMKLLFLIVPLPNGTFWDGTAFLGFTKVENYDVCKRTLRATHRTPRIQENVAYPHGYVANYT